MEEGEGKERKKEKKKEKNHPGEGGFPHGWNHIAAC
jgi:hypothetical protein